MNLIRASNPWSCTLASAAMVMNCTEDDIIKLIEHDGSEIIADIPSPGNHKGFHMQEIIDAAIDLGFSVTPIERDPVQTPDGNVYNKIYTEEAAVDRWAWHRTYGSGILMGPLHSYWHAVAWDGENIYDPRGKIYSYDLSKIDFKIFWRFDQRIRVYN